MTIRREDDNDASTPQPERVPQPITGLPPEWGPILIPDDPAALAIEATKVRRELRRNARRRNWLSSFLRSPTIIIVLITLLSLTSLFTMTNPILPGARVSGPTIGTEQTLAEITLTNEQGDSIRIGDHIPVVLLLLDGCACATLANSIAAAIPTGVSLLTVGQTAPTTGTAGLRLADPTGQTRRWAGVGPAASTEVPAILVDGHSSIVRVLPSTGSAKDLDADLAAITP